MKNEFGFKLFKYISNKIVAFLDFTDVGSQLVFGKNFKDHYFAFKVT